MQQKSLPCLLPGNTAMILFISLNICSRRAYHVCCLATLFLFLIIALNICSRRAYHVCCLATLLLFLFISLNICSRRAYHVCCLATLFLFLIIALNICSKRAYHLWCLATQLGPLFTRWNIFANGFDFAEIFAFILDPAKSDSAVSLTPQGQLFGDKNIVVFCNFFSAELELFIRISMRNRRHILKCCYMSDRGPARLVK